MIGKNAIFLPAFAAAGMLLYAVSTVAQSPDADSQGDADRGKARYTDFGCYACHGYTGETGDGARLNPPRFRLPAFMAYVRNPPIVSGGPFGMPAYNSEAVTDQVLADIYAYLRSLPSGTPPLEDIALLNDL